MFHKIVNKAWNLFNIFEQSPENSAENLVSRFSISWKWSSALFNRSNRNRTTIETSRNSRIIFLPFSIERAKTSTDWKCWIPNFHLENSRTWIFILWNNILQIQTSLLQPIHVYTYIYNNKWLRGISIATCLVLLGISASVANTFLRLLQIGQQIGCTKLSLIICFQEWLEVSIFLSQSVIWSIVSIIS